LHKSTKFELTKWLKYDNKLQKSFESLYFAVWQRF